MQVVMSKKKKYILLLLVILVLSAVTAGIYLFVNPKINGSTSYTVDKYSDVTNWCDTNREGGKLNVDCKALLINIDSNSCFEVQVITKDKELKDLTVCEKNGTLSYTNDVLGYKKLMPVDMIFTYSKEGILRDYSFANVSFSKIDGQYIQNVVENDMDQLLLSKASNLSIKNSFDVCPTSYELRNYLFEDMLSEYSQFYSLNILKEDLYHAYSFNSLENYQITLLFACDSSSKLQYNSVCNLSNISKSLSIEKNVPRIFVTEDNINWNNNLDTLDIAYLKEISLIYDNLFLKNDATTKYLSKISSLINAVNIKENLGESTLCALYPIYQTLAKTDNQYIADQQFIENFIQMNIKKITSPICGKILQNEETDARGLYLKLSATKLNTGILNIYNQCSNLRILANE